MIGNLGNLNTIKRPIFPTIKRSVMEKTRTTHWLMAQGYRPSKLPPVVTWYVIDKSTGMEREFKGRTDDYTLDLNQSKGFVLDRKYLDPQLWFALNT